MERTRILKPADVTGWEIWAGESQHSLRAEGPGESEQEACLGLLFYGWAGSLDRGRSPALLEDGEKDKPRQEIGCKAEKWWGPWGRSL